MKKIFTTAVALLVMGSMSFAQDAKKVEKKEKTTTKTESTKTDANGDKKETKMKKKETKTTEAKKDVKAPATK